VHDSCAHKEKSLRERTEEWKELCRQAAVEQDPQKLLELTRRINELLIGKQHRLEHKPDSDTENK
jgi:hypothetical protein